MVLCIVAFVNNVKFHTNIETAGRQQPPEGYLREVAEWVDNISAILR
jgi:hypothetical protein